jgi:preprotein translocase subunit SecD
MKKKKRIWPRILIIFLLVIPAILIDLPNFKIEIPKPVAKLDGKAPFVHMSTKGTLYIINNDVDLKRGLDLQGGSRLVYIADLSKIRNEDKDKAMESLKNVIENRINAFGITEPLVQTTKAGNEYRLAVEMPGLKNTDQAMNLIGKTANLEFQEFGDQSFKATDLTGKDLKKADVVFEPNTGAPQISLQFNSEGAKKFEQITERNVGKPLGIALDGQIISAPNVNEKIAGGNAQITGKFTFEEAKGLAVQLNAGALPAPISLTEQKTLEATLGQESVNKSLVAGIIGIIVVSLFMLTYYRLLGVFAVIGLFIYLALSLATFKIIGVTITMGGIAAFILDIGMSMETDVLVFERIREELRRGRDLTVSIRVGFQKAWPSIRDANIVSLVIAAILYWRGQSNIRGFAIVLAIGIVIGLFTTFFGTRVLLELAARRKLAKRPWFYRVEKEEEVAKS